MLQEVVLSCRVVLEKIAGLYLLLKIQTQFVAVRFIVFKAFFFFCIFADGVNTIKLLTNINFLVKSGSPLYIPLLFSV